MFLIIEALFFITLPYVSLSNGNFVYNEESCQPHLFMPNKKLYQTKSYSNSNLELC